MEQFVFEVLVIFVESLALAHSDERSMGIFQYIFIYAVPKIAPPLILSGGKPNKGVSSLL